MSKDIDKQDITYLTEIIPKEMNNPTNGQTSELENQEGSTKQEKEFQQASAAVTAIKAKLEQIGKLEDPEIKEQIEQIEKLARGVEYGFNGQISSSVQKKLQATRKIAGAIAEQMNEAANLEDLFKVVVTQLQKILRADRVIIYHFSDRKNGVVLKESMLAGWTPMLAEKVPCLCFGGDEVSEYEKQEYVALEDVRKAALSPYQLQLLDKYQIKASIALPIIVNKKIWGLLIVNQCGKPRAWQETEITLLYQTITELVLNLQPTEFQAELEKQAKQEEAIEKVIRKIQRTNDIKQIFRTATQEIRKLLKADRSVVYRFYEDWSGEVVAESVGSGWVSLIQEQDKDPSIRNDLMSSDQCSVKRNDTEANLDSDTYFRETKGGIYNDRGVNYRQVDDIYAMEFSTCYLESLEKFQCKAYINIPIFQAGKLWGLFCVYQNSGPRKWQDWETRMLVRFSVPLGTALNQLEVQDKLKEKSQQIERIVDREETLNKIISKIRQSSDYTEIFTTVTQDLRQILNCDRSVVYRFYEDWSGEVIAESVGPGWVSLMQQQDVDLSIRNDLMSSDRCTIKQLADPTNLDTDTYLKETQGGMYNQGERYRQVDDIYKAGFSRCYLDSLEKFQCKAYINVPIFAQNRLWGLLCVYQNDAPREWRKDEVELMARLSNPLGLVLKQASLVEQIEAESEKTARAGERDKALARITDSLRETSDLNSIFRIATQEIRQFLNADRSVVYRFYADWSGEVVAESVGAGWISLIEQQQKDSSIKNELMDSDRCTIKQMGTPPNPDSDTYLKETEGGIYNQGDKYRKVDDIYKAGFSRCYLDSLEKFQCKAYINVPIFQKNRLWGLLCVYQNDNPRNWKQEEVEFMTSLSSPLGVALQQAEFINQIQAESEKVTKAAERERSIAKINDKIRESLELDTIFSIATQELRQLLNADRSVIYRFYPDWSGEVVAESVAAGWISLMKQQQKDASIKQDLMSSDRCTIKQMGTPPNKDSDTYLKDTKGGMYVEGDTYRKVDDIYAMDFSACYISSLEKFQARAYINVPIFQGNKLWGLLCVYQNDGPRKWENSDVSVLQQIGGPLSVAIEQAESLVQIQKQSEKLERQTKRQEILARVTSRLFRALDLDRVFRISTQDVRNMLAVDRVALYQFDENWGGKFVAESASSGWNRVIDVVPVIDDSHLQDTQGGRYKDNDYIVVEDIYTIGHSSCHIELLEQMQARAYMIVPVFVNEKLWGLLG
ncbi:MAG: GAF domain-containing protein, partial [Prochloraceae cyanobacterium]